MLVRPARTFQALAAGDSIAARTRPTFWTAARRPIFLSIVLGAVTSLIAASVASLRLIAGPAVYSLYVPLIEIFALGIVLWRSSGSRLPALIDVFFAGHAAWTIFLLLLGTVVPVTSPMNWWFILVGPAIAGVVIAVSWSAYIDVCFFRFVCGSPLRRALGQAALHRFISWTLIFWIFAVPEPTPLGVFQEIVDAVREIAR